MPTICVPASGWSLHFQLYIVQHYNLLTTGVITASDVTCTASLFAPSLHLSISTGVTIVEWGRRETSEYISTSVQECICFGRLNQLYRWAFLCVFLCDCITVCKTISLVFTFYQNGVLRNCAEFFKGCFDLTKVEKHCCTVCSKCCYYIMIKCTQWQSHLVIEIVCMGQFDPNKPFKVRGHINLNFKQQVCGEKCSIISLNV